MYTHINALKMVLEILRKLDGFEVRNFQSQPYFPIGHLCARWRTGELLL